MKIRHRKEWHVNSVMENMDLLINRGVIWKKVETAFVYHTTEKNPHGLEI